MVAVPAGTPTLLESVRATLATLNIGPQHAAMVRSAELLAHTIDGMDREERAKMLAQTIPVLGRVLDQLTATAGPGAPRGVSDAGLRLLLGEDDDGAA